MKFKLNLNSKKVQGIATVFMLGVIGFFAHDYLSVEKHVFRKLEVVGQKNDIVYFNYLMAEVDKYVDFRKTFEITKQELCVVQTVDYRTQLESEVFLDHLMLKGSASTARLVENLEALGAPADKPVEEKPLNFDDLDKLTEEEILLIEGMPTERFELFLQLINAIIIDKYC